jgi:ATP-dependent RNA helicase DeaD
VFESAARGKDLVVQARTGTGKTAAFGLPLLDRLVRRKVKAVQALILCPTRELALQVTRELEALGKNTGILLLPVYGGAPMLRQIEGLKEGAQILVGTPGRVLDHLRRKTLDPSKIRILVLDECDEMLSMGFLPQITEIWNQLPKELQVLLFSATVPRPVLRVADSRLREPEFVTLSGDQVGALEIEHYVYMSQGDKVQELLRILKAEAPESAIVFCNTRDDTQRVATELQKAGYNADWLNADLSQKEREAVMLATREERLAFLVCTDVAARGIDISHLTHVINFDFPEATEQYVHRTGRTGRAGRMGTAISLVSPSAIGNLYYLRLEYKIHPIERQLPSDRELRTRAETDAVLQLSSRFQAPREAERSLVQRLLTHERSEAIIAGLLREHLKAAGAEGARAPRAALSTDAARRPPRSPAAPAPKDFATERARRTTSDDAAAPREFAPRARRAPSADAASAAPKDLGAERARRTASSDDAAALAPKELGARPRRTSSDDVPAPPPKDFSAERPRRTSSDDVAAPPPKDFSVERPRRTSSDDVAAPPPKDFSAERPRRMSSDDVAAPPPKDFSAERPRRSSGEGTSSRRRERVVSDVTVVDSSELNTDELLGEPVRIDPPRERRDRGRGESPALRRGPRPARAAGASFSEEGFSYEVRDVSAGDLAAIQDHVSPAVSSGAVMDMAAPAPEAGGISWDGPVDEAFVNVGRDDGVRTSDLHQALITAGVSEGDTAYVRIRQRHTFIGVRQGLLDQVVSGLNGQKIAQRLVEAQPARPRQARR